MAKRGKKSAKRHDPREDIRIPPTERIYWLIPCLAAFALYLGTLRFGFIFDDYGLIVMNPQVHSSEYLPRLLSTHLWSHISNESMIPQYRPFFSVWLLIVYSMVGASTWLWHLSSVLLNVLATYLVFWLGLEVLENTVAASVTALLFGIHPIHIEPVSWVSSCNELVYTSLVLASLLVYFRNLRWSPQDQRCNRSTLLSVSIWSIAVFTKESALAVLPAFLYLDFRATSASLHWLERSWQTLKRATPYFAALLVYSLARLLSLGRVGLEQGRHSWAQVIYSSPSIIMFYLKKLVFPAGLSGFYVNPLISAPTNQMWLTLILLLIVVGALVWLSVKNLPAAGLASVLLFFPMLPVIAGVRTFGEGDLAHDRYMYLPSVGLCLLVGLLATYFLSAPKAMKAGGRILACAVAPIFVWLTLTQQRFYRDAESYFGRGVEVGPTNVTVRDYLGDVYTGQHRLPEALDQFKLAHELEPNNPHATFSLAKGLFTSDQYNLAEPYLEELTHSSEIRGNRRATVLLALGQSEIRLNRLPRAEEVLKQLANENESCPGVHDTLGAVYQIEGRNSEAQSEYMREFQVSGNAASRQKALYLARLIARYPADPHSAPSQRFNSPTLFQHPLQGPLN